MDREAVPRGQVQEGCGRAHVRGRQGGLAGAYNRLTAAADNAEGDPLLSKAVAPLTAGIASLRGLATKIGKGEAGAGDVGAFESVINSVKDAGKSAGAEVKDKVPSTSQLGG